MTLTSANVKLDELAKSPGISSGVDLLTSLFTDEDANVRKAAMEVYVRRVYRAYRITSVMVEEATDGHLRCKWEFQPSDCRDNCINRQGILSVAKTIDEVEKVLGDVSSRLDMTKPMMGRKTRFRKSRRLYTCTVMSFSHMESI